jgi:uncharacterized protein YaiE (UPF0345 family)
MRSEETRTASRGGRTGRSIGIDAIMFTVAAMLATACGPLIARGSSPFQSEKGKFRILVNGQEVGKEEFEIGSNGGNWFARGTSDVQTPEGMTHVTGTLELHADGTPVRYEWSTQSAKKAGATVTFNGPVATIELHSEGARPFTQQFTFATPQIAVLDNNLYYQYAILARLYDKSKKGQQSFAVLVPQELTPGSVTVESVGNQDVDGKKLDELQVKSEDLEVDLYLDGDRLVRIVSPSVNAEIIRE